MSQNSFDAGGQDPRPPAGPHVGLRPAAVLIGRALRLRCPNCGQRRIFRRWIHMRESCPRCHLLFDRGERDYFIGSYTLNFVGAELMIVGTGLIFLFSTWPDVPGDVLKWGLLALMIPFPVFTYPFAKTIWLAIDLLFRPPTLADFAGHGENEPPGGGA
jgi:uncharacterized protein (DUF983 family)